MPTPITISSSPSTQEPSPVATVLYVTTSWDDGHPLDWRIAELLTKHGLPGTFYIPRNSQRPTMGEADVRRLSESFEIGGHTLDHLALTTLDASAAWQQVAGCKTWVEDVTGTSCPAFCPPLGKFDRNHVALIRRAGFKSLRTVELMSLDVPRKDHGLMVLPTSVQAHPHRRVAYIKNSLRRGSPGNLVRGVFQARSGDWVATCRRLLDRAVQHGGVFHLWGHSWEIEENDQWRQLDEALRLLASAVEPSARVSNSDLLKTTRARAT